MTTDDKALISVCIIAALVFGALAGKVTYELTHMETILKVRILEKTCRTIQ